MRLNLGFMPSLQEVPKGVWCEEGALVVDDRVWPDVTVVRRHALDVVQVVLVAKSKRVALTWSCRTGRAVDAALGRVP